jgi:hypothetical protein
MTGNSILVAMVLSIIAMPVLAVEVSDVNSTNPVTTTSSVTSGKSYQQSKSGGNQTSVQNTVSPGSNTGQEMRDDRSKGQRGEQLRNAQAEVRDGRRVDRTHNSSDVAVQRDQTTNLEIQQVKADGKSDNRRQSEGRRVRP